MPALVLLPVAVAVLTAAAAVIYARRTRRSIRRLQRALANEQSTARLTGAAHARDMAAFRRRLAAASAAQPHPGSDLAVTAAEQIVDAALAHHTRQEGGTP